LLVLLFLPTLPSILLLLKKKAVQQIWGIIDCALTPKIAQASPEVLVAKKKITEGLPMAIGNFDRQIKEVITCNPKSLYVFTIRIKLTQILKGQIICSRQLLLLSACGFRLCHGAL